MPSEDDHKQNIWKRKDKMFFGTSKCIPLLNKQTTQQNHRAVFIYLKKKYAGRTETGELLIFRKGSTAFLGSYAVQILPYLFPQCTMWTLLVLTVSILNSPFPDLRQECHGCCSPQRCQYFFISSSTALLCPLPQPVIPASLPQ